MQDYFLIEKATKRRIKMEDFLKRKLEIGDSVVMLIPRYRNLVLGRIVKFGTKMVTVQFQDFQKQITTTPRYPGDVVKVDGPDLTRYLLLKE